MYDDYDVGDDNPKKRPVKSIDENSNPLGEGNEVEVVGELSDKNIRSTGIEIYDNDSGVDTSNNWHPPMAANPAGLGGSDGDPLAENLEDGVDEGKEGHSEEDRDERDRGEDYNISGMIDNFNYFSQGILTGTAIKRMDIKHQLRFLKVHEVINDGQIVKRFFKLQNFGKSLSVFTDVLSIGKGGYDVVQGDLDVSQFLFRISGVVLANKVGLAIGGPWGVIAAVGISVTCSIIEGKISDEPVKKIIKVGKEGIHSTSRAMQSGRWYPGYGNLFSW